MEVTTTKSLGRVATGEHTFGNPTTFTTGMEIHEFVDTLKGLSTPASTGGYQGISFWAAEFETAALWNAATTITIGPSGALPVLTGPGGGAISPPVNGSFSLQINLAAVQQVTVQASDTPAGPWVDVATVSMNGGIGTFIDLDAGSHPNRFYRLKP